MDVRRQQASDRVGAHHPAGALVKRVRARGEPPGADQPGLLGLRAGGDDGARILDRMRQRRLTVDMLAGGKGRFDELAVPVGGGADHHRVEFWCLQELLPVRVAGRVRRAPHSALQASGVLVAEGDDARRRDAAQFLEGGAAPARRCRARRRRCGPPAGPPGAAPAPRAGAPRLRPVPRGRARPGHRRRGAGSRGDRGRTSSREEMDPAGPGAPRFRPSCRR